METVDQLEREYKRLAGSSVDNIVSELDVLIEDLKHKRAKVSTEPTSCVVHVSGLKKSITEQTSKIKSAAKSTHSALLKFNKCLDNIYSGIGTSYNPEVFPPSSAVYVNRAIIMHLIRTGQFDVAKKLMEESAVDVDPQLLVEFSAMKRIVDDIVEKKNLDPAITWATSKRQELSKAGSDLEYALHRLKFIQIYNSPDSLLEACMYARKNFPEYGSTHLMDIAKLATAGIFKDSENSGQRLEDKSPYKEELTLSDSAYKEIAARVAKEYCAQLGLSPDSPLYLAYLAGGLALPDLTKFYSMMRTRRVEWSTENELPVEVELPASLIFHPIFICPITKEQTCDENPPMKLPCGHIISRNALTEISKGSSIMKFKCPYCPVLSTSTDAVKVNFNVL